MTNSISWAMLEQPLSTHTICSYVQMASLYGVIINWTTEGKWTTRTFITASLKAWNRISRIRSWMMGVSRFQSASTSASVRVTFFCTKQVASRFEGFFLGSAQPFLCRPCVSDRTTDSAFTWFKRLVPCWESICQVEWASRQLLFICFFSSICLPSHHSRFTVGLLLGLLLWK